MQGSRFMEARAEFILPTVTVVVLFLIGLLAVGCASDSQASRGAQQGATTGAVAGAVGGVVGALVWGGNVGEAAVKSAAVGASSGAAVGAMSGAQRDKAAAGRQQAEVDSELAEIRKKMGEDAYNGIVALADCKHEVAIANAREAARSSNKNYALAGLWVEVITEADRRDEARARSLFPELIARDKDVKNEAQAEVQMRESLQQVMDIRANFGLPRVCGA
jgi:hypothetical protein